MGCDTPQLLGASPTAPPATPAYDKSPHVQMQKYVAISGSISRLSSTMASGAPIAVAWALYCRKSLSFKGSEALDSPFSARCVSLGRLNLALRNTIQYFRKLMDHHRVAERNQTAMAMTSHTLGSAIVVVHPSRQDPFWRKPNNWDWSRGQRGVNQLAASISDECRGGFRCLAHIM